MYVPLVGGQVRLSGDKPAVHRWLQRTIDTFPYAPFADEKVPVFAAKFARAGDPRSAAVETVLSTTDQVRLTWYDCIDPVVLTLPPGFNNRPLGVFSPSFPARPAQVERDGRSPPGPPRPQRGASAGAPP